MLKTSYLVLFLVGVGGSLAQNYCALCSDHTMCIYGSPGPRCARLASAGLDGAQRAAVVAAHNQLRARVAAGSERGQPSASNMRDMEWDSELATIAQRWANQCSFGHDSCRNVPRFGVGQNVYMTSTTGASASADWRAAVQAWYEEVEDFDSGDISPFRFSLATGHYTQIAWADTHLVGCGFAQFDEGGWRRSYYVCNYGPSGNVIGAVMYKQGQTCSQCAPGARCLCG